jgi:signal transduction histidine kinase
MTAKLNSIENRILFWIIVITSVPLIMVIFQGYHCSKQAILETKNNQLLSILEWKSNSFENKFAELENELNLLSIVSFHNQNTEDNQVASCHKFGCTCNPLTHIQETKQIYHTLTAYNTKGKEVANSNPSNTGTSKQISKELMDKLNKSKNVYYFKTDNDLYTVNAGAKLIDKNSKTTTGYVIATINLKEIFTSVLKEAPNFGKSGEIFLISKNGVTIKYNKKNHILIHGNDTLLSNLFSRHIQNQVFEAKIAKNKKIIAFNFLTKPNFFLVISVDKKDSLKWISILLTRSILTGLLAFIIAVVAGIMISKKLSAPLKQLENVSNEIINGNLNARVPKMDTKEAQAVSTGFNSMIDKLVSQSKELAQASSLAAIGELSSSIVHEMRNPLSSVKINIRAIKEKLKGDPTFEELAEIASIQASRLELMLSELLNYGKPLNLNITEISPVNLVKESVELIASDTVKLKQNVVILTNIENKVIIEGDKEHLTRAITNLIKNASQATKENGTITVSVKKSGHTVQFTVEDQGDGISDAIKDMIFKPFFTTKDSGTGLGLPNVKKIVEYHRGKIYVQNKKNGGAIFTIELPILNKESLQ